MNLRPEDMQKFDAVAQMMIERLDIINVSSTDGVKGTNQLLRLMGFRSILSEVFSILALPTVTANQVIEILRTLADGIELAVGEARKIEKDKKG